MGVKVADLVGCRRGFRELGWDRGVDCFRLTDVMIDEEQL